VSILAQAESVVEFAQFGIRAFTTTRSSGSFGLSSDEQVRLVMQRWQRLREELQPGGARLASAIQVHGARVVVHSPGWEGWLRVDNADGHATLEPGVALAVGVADCVPVFIAHPRGAIALLHSGWRGTAARIIERGIEVLSHRGIPASELRIHLGPAICGKCYEVGSDVYRELTGRDASGKPTCVDLRALIAHQARAAGAHHVTISGLCTRCDNDRLFSHRAGDTGRQIAVMMASPVESKV
jgi:purine-nucleoside/S-methyl-5'-thioadenosine phosphorylase / adenosine deaminase